MPAYARWAIPVLLVALLSRLVWQGMHSVRRLARKSSEVHVAAMDTAASVRVIPWERDVMASLEAGLRDGGAGNVTAAEMDVDRAESMITAARLQSRGAQADFFALVLAGLDRVLQGRPGNERLFEHVAEARISLAELRSATNVTMNSHSGPAAGSYVSYGDNPPGGGNGTGDEPYSRRETEPSIDKRISFGGPHEIAANQTLDPGSLGGNYLDAMLMPDASEILLPPASRLFADNVRVENLTLAGASQTLDGIHWRNVTFIGTRLRYEGGELDLHNVHFLRCTFGFTTTGERGARLANAIALGQASIAIE